MHKPSCDNTGRGSDVCGKYELNRCVGYEYRDDHYGLHHLTDSLKYELVDGNSENNIEHRSECREYSVVHKSVQRHSLESTCGCEKELKVLYSNPWTLEYTHKGIEFLKCQYQSSHGEISEK